MTGSELRMPEIDFAVARLPDLHEVLAELRSVLSQHLTGGLLHLGAGFSLIHQWQGGQRIVPENDGDAVEFDHGLGRGVRHGASPPAGRRGRA